MRFTTPRKIIVDAGREAEANRSDVEAGLKTLETHFGELGLDFEEELETRAQNARAILNAAERYKVPVEMLWGSKGSAPLPSAPPKKPEEDEEEPNEGDPAEK